MWKAALCIEVAQRENGGGVAQRRGASLGPEGDQEWKGRASQDSRELDKELENEVAEV